MRRLLASCCLLAAASGAAPRASAQGAEHLVGRPYAGLPGGWAELAGGLLGGPDPDGQQYGLSEHRRFEDAARLFIYDRIDQMQDGRYPVATVLAALVVDGLREGETATAFGCGLRDGDEAPVVAVVGRPVFVESESVYRYGPVRLAWRLDRPGSRFVPLAPDRVACRDEEPAD